MQDPDTPPEAEEAEIGVGGDVVRLVVVAAVAVQDNTVDVVGATDSRTAYLPLPWTTTTVTMGMAGQVDGGAVALAHPTCSPILNRCRNRAKMLPPKYLPLSTTCSSWPRFRRRPVR